MHWGWRLELAKLASWGHEGRLELGWRHEPWLGHHGRLAGHHAHLGHVLLLGIDMLLGLKELDLLLESQLLDYVCGIQG